MGGVLIIISIVVPTLLWADLRYPVRLDRAAGAAGLRLDRLPGRLRQDHAAAQSRAHRPAQAGLPVLDGVRVRRRRCWSCASYGEFSTTMNVPFFKQFQPVAADSNRC